MRALAGQPGVFDVLGGHDYAGAGAWLVAAAVSSCTGPLGTGHATALVDEALLVGGVSAQVAGAVNG